MWGTLMAFGWADVFNCNEIQFIFFFSFVVSAVGVLRKFYILQGQKHIIFYSFTDGLLF